MEVIDIDKIPSFTNDELYQILKDRNLCSGPITGTTRILYERKLRNYLSAPQKPSNKQKENEIKPVSRAKSNAASLEIYKKTTESNYQANEKSDKEVVTQDEKKVEYRKPRVVDDWNKPKADNILANIVNSNVPVASNDKPARQVDWERPLVTKDTFASKQQKDDGESKTRDDINVRFVRNDVGPQLFSGTRFNSTFSTPQTDKFANRLNSYGLLRQQNESTKSMITIPKTDNSPKQQQLRYATVKPSDPSPMRSTRTSPENHKIFANSIIRDNQSDVSQRPIKSRSPIHSRKSPENHKIFASSIIRDNSPVRKYGDYYTQSVKVDSEARASKVHSKIVAVNKSNEMAFNWKYLSVVGFLTVVVYLAFVNIQYLFSSDDLF